MRRSLFWSFGSDTANPLKESQFQGGNSKNASAIYFPLISLVCLVVSVYA